MNIDIIEYISLIYTKNILQKWQKIKKQIIVYQI